MRIMIMISVKLQVRPNLQFYRSLMTIVTGVTVSKLSIIIEFWHFLRVRKKWWLIPIVVSLLLLGALIVFAEGSALSPWLYTFF